MNFFVRKTCLLVLCGGFLINSPSWSQISFCPGNTGEAIFEEDFGQGITNGPALGNDVTTYSFVNQAPQDGQYTISSNLMQLSGFHDIPDHTGNLNGKALIVNASFDAGLFFQIPVNGLCENNPYEFSAFLVNIYNASTNFCSENGIPVNVKFQIWDQTNTTLLAEGSTGDIQGSNTPPNWQQYAVTFETLPNQTSVILKMLNNGDGGCGNDLAIDDIVFKSCGDLTQVIENGISESLTICKNDDLFPITLTAQPDFSVYDSHFYQWQQSTDGINWQNIPDETSENILVNQEGQTQFYRVLVAEDLINVNNNLCNSTSNVFELNVIEPQPAISLGDVEICKGEVGVLQVEDNPALQVSWYDAPEDGNLLLENSFSFEPNQSGVYYAETKTIEANCLAEERTPVEFIIKDNTPDESQTLNICAGDTAELNAKITSAEISYLWSTGETSAQINVEEEGTYTVDRENSNGCISKKTFQVSFFEKAIVQDITTVNNNIVIELQNSGDFSFSINGKDFQSSPVFENVPGGLYEISIKSEDCEAEIILFPHLVIPKFFTPNNDGYNDFFKIPADRFFEQFSIHIFDRYGKLLVVGEKAPFTWDGTYKGKTLPAQDYWYKLNIDGKIFTGNLTIKR